MHSAWRFIVVIFFHLLEGEVWQGSKIKILVCATFIQASLQERMVVD
jgi:hypothetical protein